MATPTRSVSEAGPVTCPRCPRSRFGLVSILLLSVAGFVGCNSKPAPPPDPKAAFRGVTIKVLVPEREGLRTWLDDQRGEWTAQTGAQVELASISEKDLTTLRDGLGGTTPIDSKHPDADILIYASTHTGSAIINSFATRIPKEVVDSPMFERKDLALAVHDHLLSWDRQAHAIPLSAECLLVYYRKDLFSDAAYREQFQKKYGRELEPPKSWDEFDDLVQFFDGSDLDGDGTADHGLAISSAGEAMICRAAAYGKPPQNFSFYFDVNTVEPLADGPAFQLALDKWHRVARCIADLESADPQLSAFAAGQTALALGSSRLALRLLSGESSAPRFKMAGKVGCLSLPGSSRLYLHDKQTWTDLPADKLNRVTVLGGLVASVPRTSKHPQVAFDLLAFLTSRERSLLYVTSPTYGLGPYRLSHLVDSAAWIAAGWPADDTPAFLSTMRECLTQPSDVTALRIAGSDQYHESLNTETAAALRGNKSMTEALSAVAQSWRTIGEELGVDRQRRQYRYSLGIPVVK